MDCSAANLWHGWVNCGVGLRFCCYADGISDTGPENRGTGTSGGFADIPYSGNPPIFPATADLETGE